MTDTDRMVAWLREAMDAAQRDAEAATPGPWSVRPEPDTGENWEIATTGREQRWVIGAEGGGGVYDKPDADHIARHNPAAVLRRIAADRKLLDELLAETHEVVEDPWYTCAAATEKHDGGRCCDQNRRGKPCDCGRDARVERRVRLLVEGWGWTEERT